MKKEDLDKIEIIEKRVKITLIIVAIITLAILLAMHLHIKYAENESSQISDAAYADVAGYTYTVIHAKPSEYSPAHHPAEEIMP